MSKNIILDRGQQFLAISLSVVLSLLVVWAAASGATTISTNITTGGTLSVSDTSTLTGAVTASTGLTVTAGGLTVTAGGATVTAGGLTVTAGVSTLKGELISAASTTVSSGNFTVTGGNIAVGTTTPNRELVVSSLSSATSTVRIMPVTGGKKGGCIEMLGASGTTTYRMYIGLGDVVDAGGAATTSAGRAGTQYIAMWEAGACE